MTAHASAPVTPALTFASLCVCLLATGCGSSLSNDVPGSDMKSGEDAGGAAMADAGQGGPGVADSGAGVSADAGRPEAAADAEGTAPSDGSVADSAAGTADSGDAGSPITGLEGGANEIIVWNGEDVNVGSGWANPTSTCSTTAENAVSHSPPTAAQFQFNDQSGKWLGGGWDWVNFQVGPYGTDITARQTFSFWLKTEGQVAELSFNLLCNGAPALDQPQHHTGKVVVSTYSPNWNDGNWHQINVPLADLTQPPGFDAQHVAELQFFNAGAGNGSFFFDDIGFAGGPN